MSGMHKIVVMNAKGGCGKTTIATNLAALYATHGYKTTLTDYDPQGSSSAWLKRRPAEADAIHGIAAYQSSSWSATRSWQMRVTADTERVIVDTPAAIKTHDVAGYLKDTNTIIVPVLSSVIDVEASTLFLHEVMKLIKLRSPQTQLVVIASRIKTRSPALVMMAELFADMGITVAGHLRDTLNYLQCTDLGLGVHDLPAGRAPLEQRALAEVVAAIDDEFEQRQPAVIKQRVTNTSHQIDLAIPHAAAGRYSLSWK